MADRLAIDRPAGQGSNVHSVEGRHDRQVLPKASTEQVEQKVPPVAIDPADAANMPREMTIENEPRHGGLNGDRTMPVGGILGRHERGQRPAGGYEKPQPKRREHTFGEGADIADVA